VLINSISSQSFVLVRYYTDMNCTNPVITGLAIFNITQNTCENNENMEDWVNVTVTNSSTLQFCQFNSSDCSNETLGCMNITSGQCVTTATNTSILYAIVVPLVIGPSVSPSTSTPLYTTTPTITTPVIQPTISPFIIAPTSLGNNLKIGGIFGFVLVFLFVGVFML